MREYFNRADDIPIDIKDIVAQYARFFPGGFDTSRFEDLPYPELWFVDTMDKNDRDLINSAIAVYNGFTYNPITELFMKNDALVLGNPILGKEETKNILR